MEYPLERTSFLGLPFPLYKKNKVSNDFIDISLVKGIRNSADFEYEKNLLRVMEDFSKKEINVVYIPCDRKWEHVSSSMIRGISKITDPKKYLV